MCVPVKADVKVDLPDPEFPTNILVSFSRNEIKFSKFVLNFADISNIGISRF